MSTAHRPTWDPAQAKEVKGGSRQYSSRDMAAHTKLKFRQPGQTAASEVAKRDLRAELLAAEEEARERKRKADGKPSVSLGTIENGASGDDDSNKRRKLIQDAVALDKDDDEESADGDGDVEKDNDNDSDQDSDEEEDDTAELLRELEKIKRERAEEKARQEREQSASANEAREAEIATSNPLLNLQAALGQTPGGSSTTSGSFTVKRRWDDDLIFKNQAAADKPSGHFVNDLLRTEFHKKFMAKFIK